MAITISGENNNDRILASDGVIDSLSGFNVVGVITATSFTGDLTGDVTGNLTGNVTGNINNTTLLLQTGGTERLRIDSNGRLLVGTTTEGHANADDLTIATTDHTGITLRSATNRNGSVFFSDGTSGADEYRGWIQYTHTSDYLTFGTNGEERLRIKSNGALIKGNSGTQVSLANGANTQLIGTAGADASLALVRQSQGGGEFYFAAGSSGTNIANNNGLGFIKFMGYHTNGYDEYARIQAYVDGTNGDGDAPGRLSFRTTPAGSATSVERLRIGSDGRIGINDSSPNDYELDIQKRSTATDANLRLYNNATGSNNDTILRLHIAGTSANNYIYFGDGDDSNIGQIVYDHGLDAMRFWTGAGERLRIDAGGLRVNKTTTSDYGRFEVKGPTADNILTGDIRTKTVATFSGSTPGTTAAGKGAGIVIKPISDRGCHYFFGVANSSANQEAQGSFVIRSGHLASATVERLRITDNGEIQPTEAVKIADDKSLKFGNDTDLYIRHSAAHGNNFIVSSNGDIEHHMSASKKIIKGFDNSGTPYVGLYHNNNLRLETRTNDVKFHGGLVAIDNVKIQLGSSGDLQLFHDGANSYVSDPIGIGNLRIRINTGQIELQPKIGEYGLICKPAGAVELYHNNSLRAYTVSNAIYVEQAQHNDDCSILINNKFSSLNNNQTSTLVCRVERDAGGSHGGGNRQAKFGHNYNGSTGGGGFFNIRSNDGTNRDFYMDNNTNLRVNYGNSNIGTTNGTVVGSQSSDIRNKNLVGDGTVSYGLSEILQLNPIKYQYKKELVDRIGFSAQQVEPIIPESVYDTGQDQDNEGNLVSGDTIKAMYYVDLIPVLVNGIKELKAENDALKKRLDDAGL